MHAVRSAAALRAWGAARVSQCMATADIVAVLQCAQIDCADISALLLEFLAGREAVKWIRALRLLHDPRYASFVGQFGEQFLPKLIFCAAPVADDAHGEAQNSDAEVCVQLPDSQ